MNTKANSTTALLLLILFIIILLLITYAVTQQPRNNSPVTLTPSPSPWQGQAELVCNTTTIQWGALDRNSTYICTVELSNIGTSTTNDLNMTSTCTIGTLTWDAEGTRINAPNDKRNATFTLTTHPDAQEGPFSFDITINY